jgi:pimeloyl-ACP methyl ester carboxylesterase
MPSRRVLLGSAVTLGGLGATAAVLLHQHPIWQRRLGLAHSPDHLAPDAHVPTIGGRLRSTHLGREVPWRCSLPPGGARATVFCLHGRGGNQDAPFDEQHLPDVAAEHHLPLAIAGVDGGEACYWHPRRDGTDALAMLMDELIPLVEQRTGTTRRLLLGWSMGGFGALLAAQQHPGMFGALAALSPALWTRPEETARGAFDGAEDFRRHDVFTGRPRLAGTPVFLACGTEDPLCDNARRFAAGLPGIRASFSPGFHEPPYWRSVAPAALQFLVTAGA